MTESICQEAERITSADRKDLYEGTDDTIVALWSAYLGIDLTVLDYANLMVLMKVARTKGKFHRDSYVDIAGYANVGPRLWLEKVEQTQASEAEAKLAGAELAREKPMTYDDVMASAYGHPFRAPAYSQGARL